MARVNTRTIEVCLVFGTASLAVIRTKELAAQIDSQASNDLLVELENAHCRLRDLFAQGCDDEVLELATNALELSERTVRAFEKEVQRPGR
jgi:streptomycin 6-kinase